MTRATSRYDAWLSCSGHLPLAAVLAAAVALRLWGLDFGLPHTLTRPDEEAVASIALRFFRRTLNPGFFDWPSLYMYAVAIGYAVYFNIGRFLGWFPYEASFIAAAAAIPAPLFLIARAISALAGVLTVGTVYRIGTRLFDRITALVGAAFLAVAALHVRDSHFGLTDVSATWLLAMSFLFTVKYAQGGRYRDAILSALWAGLAASTKYNAGAIVVPGAWAIATGGIGDVGTRGHRARLLLVYLAVAAAAFVLGTPYSVLDPQPFLAALRDVSAHLRGGHAALAGYAWRVHLMSSLRYGLGVPMLAAGVGGLALLWWRDRKTGVLFAIFPIVDFVFIGAGQTAFARHIIPTVPFLCMAAAFLTVQVANASGPWFPRHLAAGVPIGLFALMVALPSAWSAIQTDRLLSRTDNRLLAAEWIHDQFHDGAAIYQSGSIYGHVQMQTSDGDAGNRYPELMFDERSRTFFMPGAARAASPEVIVVTRCPLSYCDAPATLPAVMSGYVPLRTFMAVDAIHPGLVYDRDDAFFVPLAGLRAAIRPGPDLVIYGRRH